MVPEEIDFVFDGIDPSFRLASTKTRARARASRQLLDSREGYYPTTFELMSKVQYITDLRHSNTPSRHSRAT